jgi:hypothetical protein
MPQNLSLGLPSVTTTIDPDKNGPGENARETGVGPPEPSIPRDGSFAMERLSPQQAGIGNWHPLFMRIAEHTQREHCENGPPTLE